MASGIKLPIQICSPAASDVLMPSLVSLSLCTYAGLLVKHLPSLVEGGRGEGRGKGLSGDVTAYLSQWAGSRVPHIAVFD